MKAETEDNILAGVIIVVLFIITGALIVLGKMGIY